MPFQISPTKVILDLGAVEFENDNFSHKTYIWPLGFKSKVQGDSTVKKGEKAWYYTEIKKGKEGQLEFHVTADDRVDGWEMVGSSASMVWKKVLEEQKEKGMLSTQKSVTVSGTDKMGINHNLVKAAIEYLSNAEKCKRYVFKYNLKFIKQKQQSKMTEYWPVLKPTTSITKSAAPKEAIPMEGKFVDKLSFDELETAHTTNSITDRNEPRVSITRKKMTDEDIFAWIKTQNGIPALTPTFLRTQLGIGYNRAKQFLTKHYAYVAPTSVSSRPPTNFPKEVIAIDDGPVKSRSAEVKPLNPMLYQAHGGIRRHVPMQIDRNGGPSGDLKVPSGNSKLNPTLANNNIQQQTLVPQQEQNLPPKNNGLHPDLKRPRSAEDVHLPKAKKPCLEEPIKNPALNEQATSEKLPCKI